MYTLILLTLISVRVYIFLTSVSKRTHVNIAGTGDRDKTEGKPRQRRRTKEMTWKKKQNNKKIIKIFCHAVAAERGCMQYNGKTKG